jgi:hypothetical protein
MIICILPVECPPLLIKFTVGGLRLKIGLTQFGGFVGREASHKSPNYPGFSMKCVSPEKLVLGGKAILSGTSNIV